MPETPATLVPIIAFSAVLCGLAIVAFLNWVGD